MKHLLAAGASTLVIAATLGSAAHAQTAQDLQARIEAQDARIRDLEAKLEKLTAATPAPQAAPAADAPKAVAAAAPSKPEDITFRVRGRLQVDALALNTGDGHTPTGTQVRRFYLGAEGKIPGGFRYQAEADFAGNKVALQDTLIGYQATPSTELIVGYFKPQVTQDDMTSDVYTLFLERSAYAGIFAPGRRVGAGVNYAGSGWGLRAGVFGEREDTTLDVDRSEAWVASARVHGDLLPGDDVLHLALSTYYTSPSATDHIVSYSQKPETNRALNVLSTGDFTADHGLFLGGEAGYGHGPFTLQAEGGTLKYDGGTSDPRFWGWSAQASWRLTGEARPYDAKSGVFGRVTPARPLAEGGPGAWELGLRATQVDLNHELIRGGELTSYSAVVNWYPMTRLRLGANLIFANTERPGVPDLEQTTGTVRAAIDW